MAVMCSLQVGKQVRSTHVDQGLLFFTFSDDAGREKYIVQP